MSAPSVVEPVPGDEEILALEAVGVRSWPPVDREELDGWLLRAAGGWTRRANSALPLSTRAAGAGVLATVREWYEQRGLTPALALAQPTFATVSREAEQRGWRSTVGVSVMTAPLTSVLSAAPREAPLGSAHIDDEPDAGWLATYGRERELPPEALAVLQGGGARFASVRRAGAVLATTRFVVEPPWVGISAMEVAPEHRRAGLARHLLAHVADAARGAGARSAWLQVVPGNTAAVTLYHRLGLRVHHTYRYHEHDGGHG